MLSLIDLHIHMSLTDRHGVCGKEEITKLLKEGIRSGVTDMVLTPHVDAYQSVSSTDVEQVIVWAQLECPAPMLHMGCEFLLRKLDDVLSVSRNAVTIGSRYLQVEFLPDCRVSTACECLYELRLQGYNPIVVHPERMGALHKSPARAIELKQEGALLQGTLSALLGNHGTRTKNTLLELLQSGRIDFLASDFHGGDYARLISDSRLVLDKFVGTACAKGLLYDVPRAILNV